MAPSKPIIDADTAEYWNYLRLGELRLQHCRACGRDRHPARWICPQCLSGDFEWKRLSGQGQIYSFVWYMKPLHASFLEVPYNVAIIELDEGPQLVSGVDSVAIGELYVGRHVEARFVNMPGDWTALRFVPSTKVRG